MKLLLLDPVAGIAGDMLLALLLDLGLDADALRADLASLGLEGWRLEVTEVRRQGLRARRVQVHVTDPQPPRHWAEIDALLAAAPLPGAAGKTAQRVFRRLAEAEAAVHGCAPEAVHFHEVGAVDALVDIVGTCCGLQRLGIDASYCGPLPLNRGFVDCAHGRLPLPAPATAELLRGVPVQPDPAPFELVTPTGAALATTLARFDAPPPLTPECIGCGAGSRELADRPNLLRGLLGTAAAAGPNDRVAVLETHIDDATGQWLGALLEDLLAAGALDVALSPLQMKKNRPGQRLTVIAAPADADALAAYLLRHATTAGVRRSDCSRYRLRTEIRSLSTPLGEARVKLFFDGERLLRTAPEYDDCRALARAHDLPLPQVYQRLAAAAARAFPTELP